MMCHWSNETRRMRKGKGLGPHLGRWVFPLCGRAWLEDFRAEWSLGGYFKLGSSLALSQGDPTVLLTLAFGWATFYLGWESSRVYGLARWLGIDEYEGREVGLTLYYLDEDLVLSGNVYVDPDEWSSDRPKWRDFHLSLLDLAFGAWDFDSEVLSTREEELGLPDGPQRVEITVERWWRSRPRWPGFLDQGGYRGEIRALGGGITHPGKGTAAYNCAQDALLSMTCPLPGPHAEEVVIGRFVEAGLRNRRRYPL